MHSDIPNTNRALRSWDAEEYTRLVRAAYERGNLACFDAVSGDRLDVDEAMKLDPNLLPALAADVA